ncbi:hypothetical protein DFH07DRAFT_972677 [Mycena maculata]|uniref:CxC2-like cysteine cluster KDZ transposase-associated domain-containing protein n=1 Tax=Mycena maculata TaxID=230809 RepID=A0AAD7HGR8_9AGAR|nr:hypothetical protein DFH07DRAFT_972677 [Mycena maculata]
MSQSRSHRCKPAIPTMMAPQTASSVSYRSSGSGRVLTRYGVVDQGAESSTAPQISRFWEEDVATSAARADPDFMYLLGDDSLSSQQDNLDVPDDGIEVVMLLLFWVLDRPLKTWYPHNDEYVAEQLLREGRGPPSVHAHCATRDCAEAAEFRCVDQACVGHVMRCARCIVATHAQLPTHFIEQWTGTHFKRSRTGLRELGLRVQLGHPPGVVCPFKQVAPHDFVLYDLSGVHEINVDYCGCMRQVCTGEGRGPDGEGIWRDMEGDFAWEDVPVEDVRAVPQRIQLLCHAQGSGTPNGRTMRIGGAR